MLVPFGGAARTVQGEVIRISGRISDEVDGNGAVNWDADFKKMGQAFLDHVGSGNPLPSDDLSKAAELIAGVRRREDAPRHLCELAVAWVALNPQPMPLPLPDYRR